MDPTMSAENIMSGKANPSYGDRGLSRNGVSEMFDRIAWRYDLLNRLLSFGTDILWRKKVTHFLTPRRNQRVLDLATGTGDQIVALFVKSDKVKSAVGMDLARNMLKIGQAKLKRRGLAKVTTLMVGDATYIPTRNCQFDAVTISFGIRNVIDVDMALREMYRVLKPGGRIVILEFSMPQNSFMRRITLIYLRHILPWVGASMSGDPYAYRYLNETIETFPCGEAFCDLLRDASFTAVAAHPFRLGLPIIYQGERPI
jgi:demethylmenaquinone methyltransferase/2-methoxy-6-polyprenyl-1,4-benzoquinol methylase